MKEDFQLKQHSNIAQSSSFVGSGFWLLPGARVEPRRVRDALAPPDSYCFAWMSGRKTRLPFTRLVNLHLGQSLKMKLQILLFLTNQLPAARL